MANLSKGSKGKPVTQLQKALNKKGAKPKLKEDGIFGPLTDAALRAFQKKNKMKVDGIAGPNTSFALNIGSRPKSLKWPIKGFDPKADLKEIEANVKEVNANFSKYVDILKNAIVENEGLKKALTDRTKMLADRQKSVAKFGASIVSDGNKLLKLQIAAEKSNDFAEIKEMYKEAEDILARMDNEEITKAEANINAFDETVKDIEKFQEGVKALKSKLKKA